MQCMRNAPRDARKFAIASAMRILRGQLSEPAPEELLWLAVIEHAVRDAYSSTVKSDKLREDAMHWIDSEDFDGVARAIGLNPRWARDKIHRIADIAEGFETAADHEIEEEPVRLSS